MTSMSRNSLNRLFFTITFVLGLLSIVWVGAGFVGSSGFALAMTVLIGGVYLLGAQEIRRYRQTTAALADALANVPQPLQNLADWLVRVPSALQNPVRQRIEGERGGLPGLALTPYLIGLLVMLGMLGTFLGMVVTFKGVVFTLEGSADLQAIRSALAAPIKGLGLAFGTSVVGVATSAMLGLMSAISRRERTEVARQLDAHTATVFRPFSLAHQRQETFHALQQQAGALPAVVSQLQALMEQIERRSQQLDEQLLTRQTQFHREASEAYSGLASSVERSLKDSLSASAHAAGESLRPVVEGAMGTIALMEKIEHRGQQLDEQLLIRQTQFHHEASEAYKGRANSVERSLKDSLSASARAAGESLQPVVENAMNAIAQESTRLHERVSAAVQAQMNGLSERFGATASTVADTWTTALQHHALTSEQQVQGLDRALAAFTTNFEQRCAALVTSVQDTVSRSHAEQSTADQQKHAAWTHALQAMATTLQSEWQHMGAQTLAQQQAVALTLEQTATLWRNELAALRNEEATRSEATAQRLGELQASLNEQVSTHLVSLGTALEAPMARLLETAAEAPKAAAEVIVQLRRDMSQLTERDNGALQERAALMNNIDALLQSVQLATGEQRAAIESLVTSAGAVLDQVGRQFADTVGAQAVRAEDVAAQVSGSAIELASLGEAFGHGVQLFSTTNEKLIDSLQRIESAVTQSIARSDDQLAYYVAQAREVIDLSITSQQGIVEDLRRLHGQSVAPAESKKAVA
jgi:hypothetical protein